jgi:uncharacterized protein YllA (UPF0747 family)
MASEDHDFEEISYFRLFGQKYTWENDASGPVGRLETSSMKSLLEQIPDLPEFISDAYLNSNNLSEATLRIVNVLFGKYGLVILDADQKDLKSKFSDIIKDDIVTNYANDLVENTTKELESSGYKRQIFPREINFFYMEKDRRERIIQDEGRYKVMNTSMSFDQGALEKLITESPEKFSPECGDETIISGSHST